MTLPITHDDLTEEQVEKMLHDCIERRRRKVRTIKELEGWTWQDVADRTAYSLSYIHKLVHVQTFTDHLPRERCCRRLASVLHQLRKTEHG